MVTAASCRAVLHESGSTLLSGKHFSLLSLTLWLLIPGTLAVPE